MADSKSSSKATRFAQPVRVDGRNRLHDDDALEGGPVEILSGDHKGRRGAFVNVEDHDPKTGYPSRILVRTNDHVDQGELIAVDYKDVKAAPARGSH